MSGPTETDSTAAAIAERVADYLTEVTQGRDAGRAADYYTADAKLVGPGIEMDRSDLAEMMRGLFDGGVRIEIDRKTTEIFVHGDVAHELAKANDRLTNPDGSEHAIRNNLFIRWERGSDGLWRFARVLLSPRDLPG